MNRLMIFSVFFMIGLIACAGHSYKIKDNNLHLYLKGPGAQDVYFLCSLDGYAPHKAKKIDGRTWEIIVPANTEFSYFYLVDGVPYKPACEFSENDDFGSQNCIFVPGT
jgi:hypothetical protein